MCNWHSEMRIERTEWGWSLYEKGEPIVGSDGLICSSDDRASLEEYAKELWNEGK